MGEVTVDFVARDQPHGGWALVLVEQGPWESDAISNHLRRIQERLYGCLDAALDGAITAQFPESRGKPLVIRLDAFSVPESELRAFFARFAAEVPKLPTTRMGSPLGSSIQASTSNLTSRHHSHGV